MLRKLTRNINETFSLITRLNAMFGEHERRMLIYFKTAELYTNARWRRDACSMKIIFKMNEMVVVSNKYKT